MAKKLEITCPSEVMEAIEKHCFSELQVEVGGFLLGTHTEGISEVSVAVKAEKTKQSQTQLTFTHETWDELHKLIDEKYPELELIGWYHSHPGFGVFMSDYDAFIQHSFFSSSHNVALVVDPLKGLRGWFVSRNEKVELLKEEKTDRDKVSTKDKVSVIAEKKAAKSNSTMNFGMTALAILGTLVLVGSVWFITSNALGKKDREISDLQNQLLFLSQSAPTIGKFAPVDGSERASALLNFQFQVTTEKSLTEVSVKVYGSEDGVVQILAANPTIPKDVVLQEGEVIVVPVKANFTLPELPAAPASPQPEASTSPTPTSTKAPAETPSSSPSTSAIPNPIPSVKKS